MRKLYIETVGAYDDEDVPNVIDQRPYTTNIAIEDDKSSGDELPDNSIIIPKKVDKNKKLLIENPPKKNKESGDSNEDDIANSGKLTDLHGGDEPGDDSGAEEDVEGEDEAPSSTIGVSEDVRRPSPLPDILGTIAAYLLQRKAKKSGANLVLDSEIGKKKIATLKSIIKNKINNDSKNGLQDFIRSFLEKLSESSKLAFYNLLEKEDKSDEEAPIENPAQPTDDPNMADMTTDPSATNPELMGQTPPSLADQGATYSAGEHTAGELGRIYELKRIYSRLIVLEKYLSHSTDDKLNILLSKTSKALEMFKLIISNIDEFLDKIDEIIIMYYDFLMATYKILRAYLEVDSEKQV